MMQAKDWWADLQALWGALAIVAATLLLVLLLFLPRDKRALARRPVAFFLVYLGLFVLGAVIPPAPWIRVVALASVLLATFRAALLLATETRPGRWLVPPLPRIFVDVLQGLLYGVVALLTLHEAGFEPGQLLTTSALLTAVLGLALQDTLGNLFSGLALQLGRPFEVGDWIELEQPHQHGRVMEIGWRATILRTLDDNEIILPNGVIAKSVVKNHTRPSPVERRHVRFGAPYAVSPERVHEVVLAALPGTHKVLDTPKPSCITADYGDNAIVYDLRYFTDDHEGGHVTDGRVRDRVWYALRRAGIAIPFPQRDVHHFTQDVAVEASAATARREQALRHVTLFGVLPDDARAGLAAGSHERMFGAGETIVRQGEPGSELYVVLEGEVAVLVGSPPSEVARLGPGKFFGEMSLLTGAPRTATVRAATGCTLVAVGKDALRPVLEEHPELVVRLGKVLAERTMALEAHAARIDAEAIEDDTLDERTNVLLKRIRAWFPT